jgi:hypothetical protein
MRPRPTTDQDVLRLREDGNSFAAIARSLNLSRAKDALAAWRRAVERVSPDERSRLVGSERARLQQLEERIRDRDAADPERLARRLAALDALRIGLDGLK